MRENNLFSTRLLHRGLSGAYPPSKGIPKMVIIVRKQYMQARGRMPPGWPWLRDNYHITDWALESGSIASSYVGKQIFR
jgi:hypothetical protein